MQSKCKRQEEKWKKVKSADGYVVQWSSSKSMSKKGGNKKRTKSLTVKISKLKPKKKYYVRICAYKTAVEEKYRFFSFGDAMFIK